MADPALPRSAAGDRSPWLIAVIVSIATFMEVLDVTIVNVSLRHIAGSVAASLDESTWIVTSYLVSNAIVLPISGWLANVIGRKRFYMGCVALFTASSVLCAFSTSLPMILIARIIQGIGGGGLAPTEQSIFADTFPPEKRAQAFALYGLTVVTAPAVGPTLGGWLTDNFSWHWCFLINLPVGLLSLTLVQLFVVEPEALRHDRKRLLAGGLRIDYVGFGLVVLGFGALQIMLDRYERDDGFSSDFIVMLGATAAASLLALLAWELWHPQPVVNIRLLRSRPFAVSALVMFLFGFMLISTTQLLPQLSQTLLNYDATTAGLTLGIGGLVTLVIMPISGFVTGRLVQPKWLIAIALAGTGWALYSGVRLDLDISFWNLSMLRLTQVVWLPFVFIPLSAVSYVGVPPDRTNEASAIINLMRNLGGSVGVSFTTTMLQERLQFHHARLAEHITSYNGYAWNTPLPPIDGMIQAQAGMMSYLDIFWMLGVLGLCIWPLALLLPRVPKGATPAH
jgi:MFS transporter, DHA2 family, multidrug resistance protein